MSLPENFYEKNGKKAGRLAGEITGVCFGNKIGGTPGSIIGGKTLAPMGEQICGLIGKGIDNDVKSNAEEMKINWDFAKSTGATQEQAMDYALGQLPFYDN